MVRKPNYAANTAGLDEAGRGALAGPVVAAACVLGNNSISNLTDSKLLTPQKRNVIYQLIMENPKISYAVGIVDNKDIDSTNILLATFKAMQLAIDGLPSAPVQILIDGPLIPADLPNAKGIIDGDLLQPEISAASIIAKVTRDSLMFDFHRIYPHYHFDKHKGYGTPLHKKMIDLYGPSPIHRMSFAPLRN